MEPEIVSMATVIEDKRTFSEREIELAASLREAGLDKDTAGVAVEQYANLFKPSHVRVVVSARNFDVDLFIVKERLYRIFSRTTIGELAGRASHDAENWFGTIFEFEYELGGSEMYLMFDLKAPGYEDLPTDGRVIRGRSREEADPREKVLEFLSRERKRDVFV